VKLSLLGWGFGGAGAVLLLAALGWGLVHPANAPLTSVTGKTAPAITIATLDGNRVSVADFRGTSLVVNFWASWCVPCRQEAPVLNAAAADYAGRVQFLGVDIQDTDSAARAYQAQVNSPYPVGPAIKGSYRQWGVTAPPETFFVDRDGIVISRFIGPLSEKALKVYLSQLAP
jgi:cytochrome c biogenesis protein CcmG/thiol:disulfide interchange protein DsbE